MGPSISVSTMLAVCRVRAAAFAVGFVLLVNAATGQEKMFSVSDSTITVMAVSASGDRVAVNGYGSTKGEKLIIVFDIKAGKRIAELRVEGGLPARGLAFSKDGKRVAAYTATLGDTLVRHWEIESGRVVRTSVRMGEPLCMTDRWIVTRQSPGFETVKVFELENGNAPALAELTLKDFQSKAELAALAPDGKAVAVKESNGRVRAWKLPTGELALSAPKKGDPRVLLFDGQNSLVVTALGTYCYDLGSGKLARLLRPFNAYAVSPDGKLMVQRGSPVVSSVPEKGDVYYKFKTYPDGIHVISADKKDVIASFQVDKAWNARQYQFTPDSRTLIVAGSDGIVRVWDVSKLQP
jgi:WD40 repeat protein